MTRLHTHGQIYGTCLRMIDMFTYSPKLHHAMITTAICLLCMAATAYTQKPPIVKAWMIGFWMFFTLTAVVVVMLLMNSFNDQTREQTDWMIAYGKLDEEGRAVMGFHFPTMRYRMKKGDLLEMFEDTNVPAEMFHEFLRTSNAKSISPERDWNSKEKPRWAWLEIEEFLEEEGYIKPDSWAGSHSWLWHGESWNHLKAYWRAGIKLRSTNEPVMGELGREYAYEEEDLPAAPNAAQVGPKLA